MEQTPYRGGTWIQLAPVQVWTRSVGARFARVSDMYCTYLLSLVRDWDVLRKPQKASGTCRSQTVSQMFLFFSSRYQSSLPTPNPASNDLGATYEIFNLNVEGNLFYQIHSCLRAETLSNTKVDTKILQWLTWSWSWIGCRSTIQCRNKVELP